MNVLLLGATGGTGRPALARLLVAGHRVTTLSRRPGAIASGPATDTRVGDATDPSTLRDCVRGQDAVLSALGAASTAPDDSVSRATRTLVEAMDAAGVARLVVLSGNGLGINGGPVVDRLLVPTVLRHVKADAEASEAAVTASALRWTLVRPFRLVDRVPPSLRYAVRVRFPPTRLVRWTTREDAARALVGQLTDAAHLRQVVWVASGGA